MDHHRRLDAAAARVALQVLLLLSSPATVVRVLCGRPVWLTDGDTLYLRWQSGLGLLDHCSVVLPNGTETTLPDAAGTVTPANITYVGDGYQSGQCGLRAVSVTPGVGNWTLTASSADGRHGRDTSQVTCIDHKFLVSGHSFLPCDQDFGLIEKQKKFHSEIHVPDDWKSVITSARKRNPFQIVNMTKNDFFSTKSLEKQITNRKIDTTDQKVEWLKIQWLNYKNDQHFKFNYKYSNNSDFPFNSVYIGKRISKIEDYTGMLDLLYPNGHTITEAKKKDLLDLLAFIPPIKHQFYNNLKVDKNHDEDYLDPNEDEHSV